MALEPRLIPPRLTSKDFFSIEENSIYTEVIEYIKLEFNWDLSSQAKEDLMGFCNSIDNSNNKSIEESLDRLIDTFDRLGGNKHKPLCKCDGIYLPKP